MSLSEFSDKVAKTLAFHARRVQRAARGLRWDLQRIPARRPVIVVGCSRAGTTLVYKTLSESREIGSLQRETHDYWTGLHPLSAKGWDTHALEAADASPADRDTVSRYFYSWTGCQRWVDKNNQNGLCVPYLRALFPDALFVYVKRSPGDNLNSLIEGWRKPDEFATWSAALPETVAVENGQLTQWCFFLAEGWRKYTTAPVEAVAAFQYEAINRAILDARAGVPSGQWIEVFYEDFLRDPVTTFRRVFEGCGLAFDARLEAHCAQVLGMPYNAFSEIRLDKWKDGRNREKIERVLPQVADVAARMGYR
ncbi:sulfotransferase family protein [Thiobacillus sedimenti]|uniref:Sulfotransferase n=1 Tax=Thiobacillus sedimenti TaxID=3110231 RepID=A0ABZ1CJR9_9PROT|nr:sulfotransferase [Thiobacillus sp. SCUT-2]WRS39630.1 sulfotransferase [Thiobacillus sp. SCUT-2]